MNPSPPSQESQNSTHNDVNLQFQETDQGGCCNFGPNKYCVVLEKLLFTLGSFIILVFLFGFFGIHTQDNAETFLLITAGSFIILGTYFAGKRYRLTLLDPPSNSNERREQMLHSEDNNTVYILSIPDGNIQPMNSSSARQNIVLPGVHVAKPFKKDNPPPYEDVVAPPPPYETLNASSLKY